MQKIQVFLNDRSGSARCDAAHIAELFGGHGCACDVTLLGRGLDVAQEAHAAAKAGSVVVAAGGDGTVNCVAAALAGSDAVLGVLPVGTLNHFARDIGLPLELEPAVRVIARGRTTTVDVAEVNRQVFLNNSSLGFYPAMVTQRERLRKVGLNKWLSMSLVSAKEFLRFRHIDVWMTLDGVEYRRRTPLLFVGNNEYTVHGTDLGTRARLDKGRLFLYLAPGLTRWGLVRMTWAALRGKVRDAPEFEEFCVTEVAVAFRRKSAWVSLDGEVRRMRGPLNYRIRPGALKVCVPGGEEGTP